MTFASPTKARAGTQLVAGLSIRGNPRLTAPKGWVKVTEGSITNVSHNSVWTYRCPAAGCAGSYTFKLGAGAGMSGSLAAYDGVASVKPVDTAATRVNASSSASRTSFDRRRRQQRRASWPFTPSRASTRSPPIRR